MGNLQSFLRPTQKDINEIEEWLCAEYKATKKGFYTDRDVLDQSFRDKTLIVLKADKKVVSFIAWKCYTANTAMISITETHPDLRRKGFIRILLDALISMLQKSGISVVNLKCISKESETVWKQLGFSEFPEDENQKRSDKKALFRIIVPVSEINDLQGAESLELWHMGDHAISSLIPNAAWNLAFTVGSRTLQQPIIYPAHYDWHICWKRNDNVAYKGKVKNFPTPISFDRFIIVTHLPNIG